MTPWNEHIDTLKSVMAALSVTGGDGGSIDVNGAFESWVDMTIRARESGRTIYFIGNGASASMSSHFAADLAKNANLHTQVFSDLSLITAIANDMSYEDVFAVPLRRRMTGGDILIAVSSSGRSPNILKAARLAPELGGSVVSLSAFDPGNDLRQMGILNFYVPAETYGLAETSHNAILHFWVDRVVRRTDNR